MSDESLTIATSTDSAAVAQAAANGDDRAARVPEPVTESEDGSVSFEHPRSERTMLLERLVEEHERKFSEEPSEPPAETIDTSESDEVEPGEETESEQTEAGADVLEQLGIAADHPHRRRIADAEEYYGPEALKYFEQRLANVDLVPGLKRVILDADNSAELLIELAKAERPGAIAQWLNSLPRDIAERELRKISANLAARENGEAQAEVRPRAVSRAPRPITPVRNNAPKSSLSADEMPYQDFKRLRERQIKNRFNGR